MIINARRSPRRGTVLVLVLFSLTVLLMVLGYCLDGGVLMTERRKLQAAADAAALAGAADLFLHYPANGGVDSSGSAAASAVAIAKANGYENDGSANPKATIETRTFGQKYLGGPKAGQAVERTYIELTITYYQPRYFSALMGSGPLPVAARAVATGSWGIPKFGMLVLEPSKVGLKLGGNGIVNVTTGMIVVNSTDSGAVTNQSNATLQANEIDITGGLTGAGTITTSPVANNVHYGTPPSLDPLSTLPAPSQPATGVAAELKDKGKNTDKTTMVNKLVTSGQITKAFGDAFLAGSGRLYLVEPGMYDSKNKIAPNPYNSSDMVVFRQASFGKNGIYYLKDSGFTSTGASLLMDPDDSGGMMFYNAGTGTSDKIDITGNSSGVVNLVGRTSGTYQGMIVFQNRSATEEVKITGNGKFNIQGTFYAPNGELNLTGNGSSQTIGSALIAKTVTLGGNGTINISFNSGNVAPQRIMRLAQ